MRCVNDTIRIFRRWRARYGCDHRAVFATTYLLLTQEIKRYLKRPGFFDDRRYLIWEVTEFANYYFRTLEDDRAGRPVPEAWRISFEAADSDGVNGAQDMLLDHDRVNEILNSAYERIVRENGERYDPLLFTTSASWDPADNIGGLEAVKGWREGVWRNAERLLTARTPAQRALVEATIEGNAATWARLIATPQVPGYRSGRDAYCAAHR